MKCHKHNTESIQYLKNVLKTWKAFTKSHQRFANALKDVVEMVENMERSDTYENY